MTVYSITVYCELGVPDDTKVMFIRYVHDHLKANDPNVVRIKNYRILHCHLPLKIGKIPSRRDLRGPVDIVCSNCEQRILLRDLIERSLPPTNCSDVFAIWSSKHEREYRQREQGIDSIGGMRYAIAGEAGQIFRMTPNSDWGIDGEIEFKDYDGNASGKRIYLQLKSGDSYLRVRIARRRQRSLLLKMSVMSTIGGRRHIL